MITLEQHAAQANTVSYTVPSAFFSPGIAPINFNFTPSLGSIDQFLSFSAGTLSSGEAGPNTVSINLLFSDQTTLAIVTPFDDIGSIPLNGILATSQFTARTLVGLSVTSDNGPADLAIPAGTVITFDRVQSVPEPMPIATLGTGLVGLALARRRSKKG